MCNLESCTKENAMKKLIKIFSTLAVVGALGAFLTMNVEAGVVGSKHDLTENTGLPGDSTIYTDGTDQVCVFCHTPHGASTEDVPLWNRTMTTTDFTMYASNTIQGTIQTNPEGISLACLSCHDGTIGFDELVNQPGSGTGSPSGWNWTGGNQMPGTAAGYMGTDLSSEHPISITYEAAADGALVAPVNHYVGGSPASGGLPLFDGTGADQVECGSCHNPHGVTGVSTFLRKSNAASALCVTCHQK